jgi:hypothetical protein
VPEEIEYADDHDALKRCAMDVFSAMPWGDLWDDAKLVEVAHYLRSSTKLLYNPNIASDSIWWGLSNISAGNVHALCFVA